jgi:predicted branched-subunit amino acid permease
MRSTEGTSIGENNHQCTGDKPLKTDHNGTPLARDGVSIGRILQFSLYSTIKLYTQTDISGIKMSAALQTRHPFIRGIITGFPVILGYFPIALAFGLLSTEHISLVYAVSMSAFVYAGASQFMALEMIGAHAVTAEIVSATFLMNFRHFIMSASISQRLKAHGRGITPLIGYWLTDETYSVATMREGSIHPMTLLGLEFAAYASWVSGTGLGFVAGSFIPPLLQESMYIMLYALFAALLVPHLKKSIPVLITAGFAAGLNSLMQRFTEIKPGWSLITAIIAASLLGSLLLPGEGQKN